MEKNFIKLLTSVACVFLGIMLFLNPSSITNLLVVALGLTCLCYAVVNFLRYTKNRNNINLILGIVIVVFSLVLILQPVLRLEIYDRIFGILLAVFLIFAGAISIKEGFTNTYDSKYIGIIFGVVLIIIGIITLAKPNIRFLSYIIAVACIAFGGLQIYEFIKDKI